MKIISLNAWAGRNIWSLTRFLRRMREDVDVFCFQEIHNASREDVDRRHPDEFVRGDVMQIIADELPGHFGVFAVHADDPVRMSNAMFIRRNIGGVQMGDRTVHAPDDPKEHGSIVRAARKLQWAVIDPLDRPKILIGNMHGLWTPDGKEDSDDRIRQSRMVRETIGVFQGPKILCGDFNLNPDTKSWQMLRDAFDQELVTGYEWKTTRTPLYRKWGEPTWDMMADYCFVSNVQVREFRVMGDVVTDHAPLYLDIS